MTKMITEKPITLIGGYLGAGKTTFINRLLNSGGLPSRTAVLVNDFGDINVDEQLIRSGSKSDQVIGLANGCVCCSIADDLTSALEVLKSSAIERVLLECSGVAEPHRARVQCHYPGYYPHASVVLVDALNHQQRCKDKYVGTLVAAQVQQADLIVISKSALNPDFRLQTLQPTIDADDQDAMEVVLGWGSDANHGHSIPTNLAPRFFTQTWQSRLPVSLADLTQRLEDLPGSVQRVKGLVATDAGIIEVQRVGTDTQLTPWTQPPHNEQLGLVIIASAADDLASIDWAS